MFLVLAVLLAVGYAFAMVLVYQPPLYTHLLLVLAIVSFAAHALQGRRA